MAIKGKKRKGGSGRPKPSAPRRQPVQRKPPLMARKATIVSLAAVVALIAGFFLGRAAGGSTSSTDVTPEGVQKLVGLAQKVDPILSPLGNGVPPTTAGGASSFSLFPPLVDSLHRFKVGDMSSAKFRRIAIGTADQAKGASDDLNALDITSVQVGQPTRVVDDISVAKYNMSQALLLYQQLAALLSDSLNVNRPVQETVVARALSLQGTADSIFQRGYSAYLDALALGGTGSTTLPSPAPQATISVAPPGPLPSNMPSIVLPSNLQTP